MNFSFFSTWAGNPVRPLGQMIYWAPMSFKSADPVALGSRSVQASYSSSNLATPKRASTLTNIFGAHAVPRQRVKFRQVHFH